MEKINRPLFDQQKTRLDQNAIRLIQEHTDQADRNLAWMFKNHEVIPNEYYVELLLAPDRQQTRSTVYAVLQAVEQGLKLRQELLDEVILKNHILTPRVVMSAHNNGTEITSDDVIRWISFNLEFADDTVGFVFKSGIVEPSTHHIDLLLDQNHDVSVSTINTIEGCIAMGVELSSSQQSLFKAHLINSYEQSDLVYDSLTLS